MTQDVQTQGKEWYVRIGDAEEGPFTIAELRSHPQLNRDTLVWKEGFDDWIPIRRVWELRNLFKDEDADSVADEEDDEKEGNFPAQLSPDGLVIDMRGEEPPGYMWVLLCILAAIYLAYKLYQ